MHILSLQRRELQLAAESRSSAKVLHNNASSECRLQEPIVASQPCCLLTSKRDETGFSLVLDI